jgi:hypothetical protein
MVFAEPAAHEAAADEGDRQEFADDHSISQLQCGAEIRDWKGKHMEHATEAGHDGGDRAARSGPRAPR